MSKRRGRPYTKEETKFIKDNKDILTPLEISKALKRNTKSIKQKIYMMKHREELM